MVFEEHPDYFELDSVIKEMIRVVTPQKIIKGMERLPDEAKGLIQERTG